jgi:hypothetical protein
MPKPRHSELETPLYVRWTPETCPYALEMRLDLITRLKAEMEQAEAANSEIGGVFLGVLPTQDSPTLRLDDLILVPGSALPQPNELTEFSLDAAQVKHLAEMSAESRMAGRPFVGFFRSHLRSGYMVPSPADVPMLSPQFPEGIFAFMLVGPRMGSSRAAAFFLSLAGQLPLAPSFAPFALEEDMFQMLPEVPAEATEDVRNFQFARSRPPLPWPAVLSFALVIFLIGTWTMGSRISQYFRPASNLIDLNVIRSGNNLKITWDHSAPVLNDALGATLVIMDGHSHRELKLSPEDLKLGQVSYERLTKRVDVVMSLDSPSVKVPAQTFDWTIE